MANHHLIPEKLIKKEKFSKLFERLKNMGRHGDRASNGIFLQQSEALSQKLNLPGHWSTHKNYTDAIERKLDLLNQNLHKITDIDLILGIKTIQDEARYGLENGLFSTDIRTGSLN